MQIVIDIPEGLKKDFEAEQWTALSCMEMKDALMNGTPLTEGFCDSCGNKNNVEYLIHPKMRICSDCSYKIHHCGFVQVKGENE